MRMALVEAARPCHGSACVWDWFDTRLDELPVGHCPVVHCDELGDYTCQYCEGKA